LRKIVVGCVEKDGNLIEGACAVAGVIFPDDGVNRVVNEVAFNREAELREDIVASLKIVPDSRIENRFTIDRLITESGAPRLKKVYADGSAKDDAFVRPIIVFK